MADSKYSLYTCSGSENIMTICSNIGVSINDILNVQGTAKQIEILQYQSSGENLPAGYQIRYPVINTGNVETNTDTYEVYEGSGDMSENYVYYSGSPNQDGYFENTSLFKSSNKFKDFNCFVTVLLNGEAVSSPVALPIYPQEFSDQNSANFSSQSILGRSVDYQIYQGSSRSTSLNLELHEELCDNYMYIHELVAYIESACYPGYYNGVVAVPEIILSIGNQFNIRGILESCSATWKPPIIDDNFINCDLNISIKETSGPYSSSDIRSIGGNRG